VNGVLTTSNYVGIGISNPLQKFTIKSLGTLTGSSSTDFDFGITDGAYAPMQLMGLVNTTGQYGLLQVVHGGVGAGNLVLQSWGGNVGIGTTSPQVLLDARANSGFATVSAMSSDGTGGQQFVAGANDGTAPTIHGVSFNNSASSTSFGLNRAGMAMFYADGSSLTSLAVGTVGNIPVVLGTNNSERMRITSNGNVLIGSSSQINSAYKLDVYGSARANEIVVNTSGADFVFDKKYALPKLSDVKAYIDKNQHLPEIPSAKEMQTNGISVGEINTKLLQKVEELTLYAIKQQKRIDQLERQKTKSEQQEARMAALENALLKLTENKSK
jgi:hypothetical protein